MSQAGLKLYWGTPLTPERNLKVDDIDTFLNGYTKVNILAFQYIKQAMDIELKVDYSQIQQETDSAALGRHNLINYARVQNAGSMPLYYFVTKVTPRAEKTILLTCHLDVINSFKIGITIGAKTLIHRQHEDRFTWEDDLSSIYQLVDYVDEGINPVLYKDQEEAIPQFAGENWDLIYRNDENIDETAFNQDNPVTAWLCADNPVKVEYATTGGMTFTYNDFQTGWSFISTPLTGFSSNLFVVITKDGTTYGPYELSCNGTPPTGWGIGYYLICKRSGTTLDVTIGYGQQHAGETLRYGSGTWHKNFTAVDNIKFITAEDTIPVSFTETAPTVAPSTTNDALEGADPTGYEYTKGIDEIDRKDARLVKIISLPYPPVKGNIDAQGAISFASNFTYDHGDRLFKLEVENPVFDYTFDPNIASPFKRVFEGKEIEITPFVPQLRFVDDPKLYHSAFYKAKFVYDSFTYEFPYECIDGEVWRESYDDGGKFDIRFVTSTTFNSKFMFIFPEYIHCEKFVTSDYEGVLPVSRNNELPIFTSQYVDYLRTAYRYDLKALDRSKMRAIMQGLGGTMLTFAGGAVSSPMAVIGGLASVVNGVMSAMRAEDGLKSKLAQMEYQSVGVGNADDIDLLKAYTGGGGAKMCYYKVSPIMKTALNNLFHYCGYARETSGIPNETSRIYFNFVQADLEILNPGDMPSYAIEEYKKRYATGLTILHRWNGAYDPDQQYENWERGMFE